MDSEDAKQTDSTNDQTMPMPEGGDTVDATTPEQKACPFKITSFQAGGQFVDQWYTKVTQTPSTLATITMTVAHQVDKAREQDKDKLDTAGTYVVTYVDGLVQSIVDNADGKEVENTDQKDDRYDRLVELSLVDPSTRVNAEGNLDVTPPRVYHDCC